MMVEKDLLNSAPDIPEGFCPSEFNPDEYMHYIEDLPLTDRERAEFLLNLWHIMAAFVRWGFGVDSVIPLLAKKSSEFDAGDVEQNIPTHEFNVAALEDAAKKGEME
jgi:hypothetical protein